ncbi:hypothetical protein CBM2637_A140056 [Cupriavidus taiwanensis]|nr:hypothetical protein CBM2637_A140056 [Cupriavidus taiwanensis]
MRNANAAPDPSAWSQRLTAAKQRPPMPVKALASIRARRIQTSIGLYLTDTGKSPGQTR